MVRFPGIFLTAALLVGMGAPVQKHRRKPAPDPEKAALQQKLADASGAIATLDSRVLELMADNAALRQSLSAGAAAATALRQKLEQESQSVAALQARLQTSEERVAQLTAERDKLRSSGAPASKTNTAEQARLEAQLEDITRRRDAYIASVLRRYRELANEYRSFGAAYNAVPNDRDLASKAGPEMTRIQSTIALAEEDLRQLNGLEAQAVLVRKSQAKARTP